MRNALVLVSLLLTALSLAKPAQKDFKVKDLAGGITMDFHDVRLEKGSKSAYFLGPRRERKGRGYAVECTIVFEDGKQDLVRVLERSVKFQMTSVDNIYKFSAYGEPTVSCWARYNTPWNEGVLLDELTVGDFQSVFGLAADGLPRVTVHLGPLNLTKKPVAEEVLVHHGRQDGSRPKFDGHF